jgi:hypothetical protein
MTAPAPAESLAQTEAELRRLACLYARAMDRNEPQLLDQILAADIVIDTPPGRLEGLAQAREAPAMLRRMFLMTQHLVHNQTAEVAGDQAQAETYCTAHHLLRPPAGEPGHAVLIWSIRYQDRFRREAGVWRFSARTLVVDWSETRPIALGVGDLGHG